MADLSIRDFYRGEDIPYRITITRDSSSVDITDSITTLTFKKKETNATPDLQVTGVIKLPATDGIVDIELTSAQTASLSVGQYYYEFMFTNADGKKTVLMADKIKVKNSIT